MCCYSHNPFLRVKCIHLHMFSMPFESISEIYPLHMLSSFFQQFWDPHDSQPNMERVSRLCFGAFSRNCGFGRYFWHHFVSISTSTTTNTQCRTCFYTTPGELLDPENIEGHETSTLLALAKISPKFSNFT